MKLRDLIDPDFGGFVRREIRPCPQGDPATQAQDPPCRITSAHASHEYHVPAGFDDADGVYFACPKCFAANGGFIGTHYVLCWRPRVSADVDPKPGRWEFVGTGLDDLTLVAGSSSILLSGPGCGAHFFIRNGQIEMC